MPHYIASHHAVSRLLERFPAIVVVAGRGHAAAQWLARMASRSHVVAQQAGMDLMLSIELPMSGGPTRLFLPVTPKGHADTWIIRTVLTEDQGLANLMMAQARHRDASRAAWRSRKGFTRPFARSLTPSPHSLWTDHRFAA